MPSGGKNSKVISLGGGGKLHFGAFTLDTIAVSADPNAPTYLTGINLFPTSSPEFVLFTGLDGERWLKNNSTESFSMQGSATYQLIQGVGGAGNLLIWSERSVDDGLTFVENAYSLRTSEVPNNSANSQTKSSAVDQWKPGESIRWAMYRSGGAVTLDSPSTLVNGGNVVEGLSFYWQLNRV